MKLSDKQKVTSNADLKVKAAMVMKMMDDYDETLIQWMTAKGILKTIVDAWKAGDVGVIGDVDKGYAVLTEAESYLAIVK